MITWFSKKAARIVTILVKSLKEMLWLAKAKIAMLV